MARRVNDDEISMLIPWSIPIKHTFDAPQEILRTIDNLGEFVNGHFIAGCQAREVCMAQIPP
eukprot:12900309-Prorocentrum_lima.AAC.1